MLACALCLADLLVACLVRSSKAHTHTHTGTRRAMLSRLLKIASEHLAPLHAKVRLASC